MTDAPPGAGRPRPPFRVSFALLQLLAMHGRAFAAGWAEGMARVHGWKRFGAQVPSDFAGMSEIPPSHYPAETVERAASQAAVAFRLALEP